MRTSYQLILAVSVLFTLLLSAQARGQDFVTYGDSFNIPVFESIDQNGVDLINGVMRASTPILESGSEQKKLRVGLTWTGKSWAHVGQPTIWRKDSVYTVSYDGVTEEFKITSGQLAQKKPITGAKLTCLGWWPAKLISDCAYVSRNGDYIYFQGIPSPFSPVSSLHGYRTARSGNLGIEFIRIRSVDEGLRSWQMTEFDYYKTNVLLVNGNQKLNISTQNHANNTDEHYLRPKGITQVVTEDSGAQWFYTFDGRRRLTAVAPPGLAGRVRLTYFDNDKVKSVTNAYGTWTYVYTTPGDFGTTTVTNPLGEQTFVKYHREHGYVTEARDALNRWTYYTYDSGHRLTRVTYPEQNYVALSYDGRGNILVQTVVPKPGAGLPQIRTAGFEGGCVSRKTCNRPLYVIDAKGNRTDFTYGPIVVGPVGFYGQPNDVGEGKPLTITSPAPFSGAVRPQVRNEYSEGLLVKTSTCKTLASCTGTDDEVVTAYNYGGTQGNANLLFGLTVTSAGVALTTCYGYDDQARRISETPPRANVASCPMGTSASLAANAIAPVAPYARVTPIFPDGSSGSPPATSYDPSTDPSDNCGTNGVICQ